MAQTISFTDSNYPPSTNIFFAQVTARSYVTSGHTDSASAVLGTSTVTNQGLTSGFTNTPLGGTTTQFSSLGATATSSYSYASSVSFSGLYTVSAYFTTASSINGVAGSSTSSGTGLYQSVFIYTYSSSTQASTVTWTVNTTGAVGSTFLSTASSSETTTTTGVPSTTTVSYLTTSTSSSTFSNNTSTTATTTASAQSYLTTTGSLPCILDTIVLADSTDWAWYITTSGTNEIDSIGVSFTQTTFSGWMSSSSAPFTYVNLTSTGATTSYSYSSWAAGITSTTISTTTATTTAYTYDIGALPTTTTTGLSGALTTTVSTSASATTPLGSTISAAITYTTSTTGTIAYLSQKTTSVSSDNVSTGFTYSTVNSVTGVTTFSGGTSIWQSTYSVMRGMVAIATGTVQIANGINSSASASGTVAVGGTTFTTSQFNTVYALGTGTQGHTHVPATTYYYLPIPSQSSSSSLTYSTVTFNGTNNVTVTSSGSLQTVPTFSDVSIGPGWQATPSSFGDTEPIGTNISGVATVTNQALGWPAASVPIPGAGDLPAIAGSVPTTLINSEAKSTVGGFDWSSTLTTVLNDTTGAFIVTTCDSFSNTGTEKTTFGTGTSTLNVAPGQGVAIQPLPQCWTTLSQFEPYQPAPVPVLVWPAFPVTT